MRRITVVAVALAGVAVVGRGAGAQARAPLLQHGVFGGASAPVGDFADGVGTGYHVGARLGLASARLPIAAHFEVQWHRFSAKPLQTDAIGAARPYDVVPVIANVDLERRGGSSNSLYLTGGVGAYRRRASAVWSPPDGPRLGETNDTRIGVNVGAGGTFALRRYLGFVELRFHRVSADADALLPAMSFSPISVGLRF